MNNSTLISMLDLRAVRRGERGVLLAADDVCCCCSCCCSLWRTV